MPSRPSLEGHRFGRLLVVAFRHNNAFGKACWDCLCDCGRPCLAITSSLRSGTKRSCGCLQKEASRRNTRMRPGHKNGVRHGLSHTVEYRTWKSVIARGTGRSDRGLYADRGIAVCERWKASAQAFVEDMGARPSKRHSIDRIDNSGGYWCGKCSECASSGRSKNCRWALPIEQRINQRTQSSITFNGLTMSMSGWADHLRISQPAMSNRLSRWPLERALTEPARRQSNSVATNPEYRPPQRVGSPRWKARQPKKEDAQP